MPDLAGVFYTRRHSRIHAALLISVIIETVQRMTRSNIRPRSGASVPVAIMMILHMFNSVAMLASQQILPGS